LYSPQFLKRDSKQPDLPKSQVAILDAYSRPTIGRVSDAAETWGTYPAFGHHSALALVPPTQALFPFFVSLSSTCLRYLYHYIRTISTPPSISSILLTNFPLLLRIQTRVQSLPRHIHNSRLTCKRETIQKHNTRIQKTKTRDQNAPHLPNPNLLPRTLSRKPSPPHLRMGTTGRTSHGPVPTRARTLFQSI
jgi:hypothetical protein